MKDQTPGFPDFMPRHDEWSQVYNRYTGEEYIELLREKPWNDMFDKRVKNFYFTELSALSDTQKDAITEIIAFMSKYRRGYWEKLHWLLMPQIRAPSIYAARANREARTRRVWIALGKKLDEIAPAFSSIASHIWMEPGLWFYPACPCYWVPPEPCDDDPHSQEVLLDQACRLDVDELVRGGYCIDNLEGSLARLFSPLYYERYVELHVQCQRTGKSPESIPEPSSEALKPIVVDDTEVDPKLGYAFEGESWHSVVE